MIVHARYLATLSPEIFSSCRVTNGAPPRAGLRQVAVSSADTAAVLGRLAVLGESMLLSGEQISTFNYVAASDTVSITIRRPRYQYFAIDKREC